MRLLLSPLDRDPLPAELPTLMDDLGRAVPAGLGPGAVWDLSDDELRAVLAGGAEFAVARGHGTPAT